MNHTAIFITSEVVIYLIIALILQHARIKRTRGYHRYHTNTNYPSIAVLGILEALAAILLCIAVIITVQLS